MFRSLTAAIAVVVILLCTVVGCSEALDQGYAAGNDLRIVGGFEALQQATMHQVSIRRKANDNPFGRGHMCGGSLINNRTVLTAAHCLVDGNDRKRGPTYFRVVGGDRNRTTKSPNTVVLDVNEVIIHRQYNPYNFDNDVGLLILSSIVPDNHPTLRPINLTINKPNAGVVCQTSGWGTLKFNVSMAPVALMAVNVTVQPTDLCNGTFSYNGFIRYGMFCAGDVQGGKDACQGDSGGPLVCNGLLAGVVSNGRGCGEAAFPGIYADVAAYRGWIERGGAASRTISSLSLALSVLGLMYGVVQRLVA